MRTRARIAALVYASGAVLTLGSALAACGGDDTNVGPGPDASTDGTIPGDGGSDAKQDTNATDAPVEACATTVCGTACVDLKTSAEHCGTCDHACVTGVSCNNGHCANELVDIAAGKLVSCVIRGDGEVWCWGSNQYGELGLPPSASDGTCGFARCRATPQKIPGIRGARRVTVGREFACAIKDDGSAWCWGNNVAQQLGHDNATDAGDAGDQTCIGENLPDGGAPAQPFAACNPTPSLVPFAAGLKVRDISAGDEIVCALVSADTDGGAQTGDVYCWGNNVQAATGAPVPDSGTAFQAIPGKVSVFTGDVVEVQAAIGSRFACAVRSNGTVWCWGATYQGRTGRTDGTGSACLGFCDPTPNQVFQAISGDAGDFDAGANAPDDPGPGPALTGVAHVRIGNGASCALKTNGTVWCWGNNYYDAFARGPYDALSRPYAQPISGLPGTIASIDRRLNATIAIEPGGNVWGWGEVTFGELAVATDAGVACNEATCAPTPVAIPALAGLNRLSAGAQHGIASKADNTVWAWGLNDHAQAGHLPGAGGDVTCGSSQTIPPNAACHPAPVQVTFP